MEHIEMHPDSFVYDEELLKREREKARKLRDSPWWKKKRSSGICYYCRQQFKPGQLTMDHLVPLIRGGRSEKENLVAACKECNSKKKYMLPHEFTLYLSNLASGQDAAEAGNPGNPADDPESGSRID